MPPAAIAEEIETLSYDGTRIDNADELLERLSADCPGCIIPAGYPVSGDMGAVRQKVDTSKMMATFCVVTRTKDVNRHGNRVQILPGENGEGLQTQDYQANPVVLFDHGLSGLALPIGTSRGPDGGLAMRFLKTKADADVFFSQTLPDAAVIFGLIDEDILRMASIGFIATKAMRIKLDPNTKQGEEGVEDMRYPFGWDFVQSSLLEWSVTPVGADAGAIRKSIDRGKVNGYRMSQGLRLRLQEFSEKPRIWTPGVNLNPPAQQQAGPALKPIGLVADEQFFERLSQSIVTAVIQGLQKKTEEKFVEGIDRPAEPITTHAQTAAQPAPIDPQSLVNEFRRQSGNATAETMQQIPGLLKAEIEKIVQPVIDEQKKFDQRLQTALGKA